MIQGLPHDEPRNDSIAIRLRVDAFRTLNGRSEVGAGTCLAWKLGPRADRGVHPAARTAPGPRRRLFMVLEHRHI